MPGDASLKLSTSMHGCISPHTQEKIEENKECMESYLSTVDETRSELDKKECTMEAMRKTRERSLEDKIRIQDELNNVSVRMNQFRETVDQKRMDLLERDKTITELNSELKIAMKAKSKLIEETSLEMQRLTRVINAVLTFKKTKGMAKMAVQASRDDRWSDK